VRTTFEELPGGNRAPVFRIITSLLSVVAATAIAVALGAQIFGLIIREEFFALQYFSYFSIQASVISFIGLLIMGVTGLRGPIDSPRAASFRSFLVLNSLLVFVTNSTLFSATPIATTASLSVQAWPDIILYGAIPSYVIAEWIFNPLRARIPRWVPFVGLLYPTSWIITMYVIAELTGWYVNPLMDPSGDISLNLTLLYLGVLTVTLTLMALVILMINRVHYRLVPSNLFES